jgi:cyanophycin synthetase
MLQAELLARGVPADRITLIEREEAAVQAALEMSGNDDLLLVFGDAIARTWAQITAFRPDLDAAEPEPTERSSVAERGVSVPSFDLGSSDEFVRDERGVLLPPIEDEHDLDD